MFPTTNDASRTTRVTIPDGPLGLDPGNRSWWRVRLVLDPRDRAVFVWAGGPSEFPEAIANGRVLAIGLTPSADGRSVREAVEENLDVVAALFEMYRGERVDADGSRRGRWLESNSDHERWLQRAMNEASEAAGRAAQAAQG